MGLVFVAELTQFAQILFLVNHGLADFHLVYQGFKGGGNVNAMPVDNLGVRPVKHHDAVVFNQQTDVGIAPEKVGLPAKGV
jgi:hypothetical protein